MPKKQLHINIRLRALFLVIFLIVLLQQQSTFAWQSTATDSLNNALEKCSTAACKADIYMAIANEIKCISPDEYLANAKKALKISEETEYTLGQYESHFIIGEYNSNCLHDYTAAIKEFSQTLELAYLLKDTSRIYSSYTYLADCYNNQADYTEAIRCYKYILSLDISKARTIQTLGNSGVIYRQIGEYTQALENYQKAYSLLYEDMVASKEATIEDTLTLMGLKYEIANVYKAIPNYDRALANYIEIQQLNEYVQFDWFFVLADIGLGDCYLGLEKYNEAIKSYNKAVATLNKFEGSRIEKLENLCKVYNSLAEAYYQLKRSDSAYYYTRKSLDVVNNNAQVASTQLPLIYATSGKVYAALNKHTEARKYLNNAIELSKETGVTDIESMAWLELSRIYQKTGQPTAALSAYQNHIKLRDSIYSRKKLQELTRIDMQGFFDRQQLSDSLKRAEEKAIAVFELQRQRILTYSGFGIVALLLVLSYFIFRNYKREKKANKIISEARDAIREEKKVSEKLLHNILPEEVAEELKERGATTAKHFNAVTVMFTDFVNFTKAGERMGSEALVEELHTCFKAFDEIIEKHNIEKIKTIGDAYLAVAGLPVPDEKHAENMLNAALEIQLFMKQHKEQLGDRTFELRIGIHSGDVVAGIVGVKKFAYDIWGDTVNTAARMEQKSQPGKINISHTTYELVKDKFNCTYRGEIEAKNKGKLMMYFVEG